MAGEWNYVKASACALPEKAATAFGKATEDFCGSKLTPVLYVGDQLVSGTNYCIICYSELMTNPMVPGYKTVIIYEDLQGNCSITRIEDVIS